MAEVYLAHDEVLDRDVALKVLKDKYVGNEEFVRLFRREARSAARLNHPNIVSVYDQGRSDDGTYYIAMEYVPGGTLKDRILEEGALDPHDAIEFASQIAQALGHAHEHGVIHRDIKSRNILLTQAGHAKVADFGIARAATATTTGSGSHPILGTPGYISPEQALGEPVGPQSDLYSLGVVLYEMLTGTLPYSGEGPASMVFQHVHSPLRSPREAHPDIPEPLNALTTKLLAKEPEDRYASAAELSDDLEKVRSSLSPIRVATEKTTTEMITTPLLSSREQQGQTTTIRQYVAVPIMEVFKSGTRIRGRLVWTLATGLCGVLVVGGLAWALTQDQSTPETSGSEEASSTEEAAPSTVQVPELYYASEAEDALADDAGLKLGGRNEISDNEIPAGVVINQDPEAGTVVEEDSAVDIVVSKGPGQVSAATQATPTNVGAAGSQGVLGAQPPASKGADQKQGPVPVQEAPSSIGAGSRQEAPAEQPVAPSAVGQEQAPMIQAAPSGVGVGSRQEDPTSPQAGAATIQATSGSSVSDRTDQKGKK
jgi:serine/threonine-protein kinase